MASNGTVFLSYARADERYATDIVARLKADGITPWQDRLRMMPGDFEDQLRAGIEGAEYLVLVMTPGALRSQWVEKEWRYARENGVCIVPVKPAFDSPDDEAELGRLRAQLPVWMQKIQTYDTAGYWKRFIAVLESPCQATRSPFMAADLPSHVVRRADLVQRVAAGVLDDGRRNPSAAVTVLHGGGGFGKTTVALTVCHDDDVQAACDGGVLWVTLGNEPALILELEKVYAALTGERPGFRTVDDATIALGRKLEGKRCLLVVDDVWDPEHLKPFLHGGAQCARLVTTRRFNIAVQAAPDEARRIGVGEPTAAERHAMLTSGIDVPAGLAPRVAELARRLGNMSLLLRIANGTLREQLALGETVEGALDWALTKYAAGIAAFDENRVVARTIELSLSALGEDRARVLALGIFPEDTAIPFPIVQIVWALDELRTRDLAQRLHDLSLATVDLRERALALHDTTRGYLASQLKEPARVHARLADEWKDPRRLSRGYAVQNAVHHIVACMADPPQTVPRAQQLLALLADARYADYLRAHGDAAALDRQLTAAIAHAARSDDGTAAPLLAALVTLRNSYAARGRDPARIFQSAAEGKLADALERLSLLGAERPWDTLARLLVAWTLPARHADDAASLAALTAPASDSPAQRTMLAWVRAAPGTVPPDIRPADGTPDPAHIAAILKRAGGSEGLEGLEPLDYGGLASGTDAAGFIAERDGPELVAFALADPAARTQYVEQYIDMNAANRYGHYRNRSLEAVLDAVLQFPDGGWARRLAHRIIVAALAPTNIEFEQHLPLAIRAFQARAGDAAAMNFLEAARTAFAAPQGTMRDSPLRAVQLVEHVDEVGFTDAWSHYQRRACALAELYAIALGRQADAAALLEQARALPKGFAGFRAFSALTLAETSALVLPGDAAAIDAGLLSATAAAHRIQDWRFCIEVTAMVNAVVGRWDDLTAMDLEAAVERFLAEPQAAEFCTIFRIGEEFRFREHGWQALPIPPEVMNARTLNDVALVYRIDPGELLRLNDWIWAEPAEALTQPLQKGDEVNVPDRDFVPILAARFIGGLLASDLPAERRTRLIQRLVPLTLSNRTALDTSLARLLLSAGATAATLPDVLLALPLPEKAAAARPLEVA